MNWLEFKTDAIKYGAKESMISDCVDLKSNNSNNLLTFWKHNTISATIPFGNDIEIHSDVTYEDMLTIIRALKNK